MTVEVERDIVSWENLDGLVADLLNRDSISKQPADREEDRCPTLPHTSRIAESNGDFHAREVGQRRRCSQHIVDADDGGLIVRRQACQRGAPKALDRPSKHDGGLAR